METEDAGAERLTFHRNQGCCLMDDVKIITVRVWATAETHARATLDTGSRLNWMSKDVAKRIGAQIESLTDENDTYHLMDGNMMQPLGKVEATWHKDGKNPSGSLTRIHPSTGQTPQRATLSPRVRVLGNLHSARPRIQPIFNDLLIFYP